MKKFIIVTGYAIRFVNNLKRTLKNENTNVLLEMIIYMQGRRTAFVCGTANEVRIDEQSEANAAGCFCNLTS